VLAQKIIVDYFIPSTQTDIIDLYWKSTLVCEREIIRDTFEISRSHGGEYEVQSLLGYTVVYQIDVALMMEAARISETSVDIDLTTRQYIPEDSELY